MSSEIAHRQRISAVRRKAALDRWKRERLDNADWRSEIGTKGAGAYAERLLEAHGGRRFRDENGKVWTALKLRGEP
jgi:hypothetical protein